MTVTFLGKEILVYGDGAPTTEADLRQTLAGLNLRDALRFIGRAYAQLDKAERSVVVLRDVPIPIFVLPYLALLLILECTDVPSCRLDEARLIDVVDRYHNMKEPAIHDDKVFEYLIRLGQSQFSFQRDDVHNVPRTYALFSTLWPARAHRKLPQNIIETATGFDIDSLLLLGSAFYGMAREGYVEPYQRTGDVPEPARQTFSRKRQLAFLEKFSGSYAQIRNSARRTTAGSQGLDRYRFNPLVLFPMVRPDRQPPGSSDVHLVPCRKFLLDRVTDGLVFDCRQAFGTSFDDDFGYVFQDYVGLLLRESLQQGIVRPEFRYSVKGSEYRTPDWIVLDGDRAIIIEVKKSLLRPASRTYGHLEAVRQDLSETLAKAIKQLVRFKEHASTLPGMPAPENMELAVVFWEESWWANSILQRELSSALKGNVVHAMSVMDLELLLAMPGARSLYEMLWSKRTMGNDSEAMDIRDWIGHNARGAHLTNPFLARIRELCFAKWGIQPDSAQPQIGSDGRALPDRSSI